MYDLSTSRLAETLYRQRLAKAADARQWAARAVPVAAESLVRLRLALSARLIAWGQQLEVPRSQIKAR